MSIKSFRVPMPLPLFCVMALQASELVQGGRGPYRKAVSILQALQSSDLLLLGQGHRKKGQRGL